MSMLKPLSPLDWEADRTRFLKLCESLIRSKVDYESPLYATASEHILAKLITIHNQRIRIRTGALRSSPIKSLYAESGKEPLTLSRKTLGMQYYVKEKRVPDTPLFITMLNDYNYR